jgi:branched-chain amino acid transport system ATP-binding protein
MKMDLGIPPLLSVEDVEVVYDHVVLSLRKLTLEVLRGAIVALLGANGAGKSTTLKAISNVLLAEGGRIVHGRILLDGSFINGCDPAELVRRGVVHVMEGRRIFEPLTVEENLRTGAYARRDSRAVRRDLDLVYTYFPRLAERRRAKAGYLSGGEQQMTAIGRGLMAHPRLMLLDEPSIGLAPMLVKEIYEIIQRLNRQENMSVLLAEQNVQMALSVAKYGYLIENGRVVLEGSAEWLRKNPGIKEFYLGFGTKQTSYLSTYG